MHFQSTNSNLIKKYSYEYFKERIELFNAFVADFSTLYSIKKEIKNTVLTCITAFSNKIVAYLLYKMPCVLTTLAHGKTILRHDKMTLPHDKTTLSHLKMTLSHCKNDFTT